MKTELYAAIKLRSPIKRKDLLELLQPTYPWLTDRMLRKEVASLIKDGACIASGNNGYSIINTYSEMDTAVEYMKKKSKSIAIRANTLIHNWNNSHLREIDQQFKMF